ncbi:hypothetical protein DFR70_11065 [Nocardia tenerifensis]|uniref:Uncharacterized protein n=1 Tax=Nocardia tenerifensis TaxID=228006 RepID=A0A318K0D2_9NOCA|nr:DUF5984 family protein [Nocardia tenerifensis]PXX60225.1 hypothetical protein DFR70_11065 [Nocardia tenerifensis]
MTLFITAGGCAQLADGRRIGRAWRRARTTELLRTQAGRPETPHDCYVEYYVARLWEDVLTLLPGALEPVPSDLTDFISAEPTDWSWSDTPAVEAASTWYDDRVLDTGYLWFGPHLRWWRTVDGDSDVITVAWHHPTDPESEIEFTGPPTGRVSVPTDEFRTAIIGFDRELFAAMAARIGELESSCPPTGIEIDLERLRHEQQDRTHWLTRAWESKHETDWAAVRLGARTLCRSATAAR